MQTSNGRFKLRQSFSTEFDDKFPGIYYVYNVIKLSLK